MADVVWEVQVSEGKWVPLPVGSCRLIEEAKAAGRRAILIDDESNHPVRAFIDDFEECVEAIGGKTGFRSIRHRCFPPIVLPSQVIAPPKEIKKGMRGKTRKLTVTEAYSRARMRMMHSNDHNLSATNLVSDAKKMKGKKTRRDVATAGRPGVVSRNIETAKSEFQIHEENDNFALSLLETDLPEKPTLNWVLQGMLSSGVGEKKGIDLIVNSTPSFLRHHEPNVVARNRLEDAAKWALARKRAKSKRARAAASSKIQEAFRAFKEKRERLAVVIRIQRWVRWHLLRRSIKKARKRNARKKKKAARLAREAAERAKWTDAQMGVLVAIELAYGPPQNRSDWALRSTFVGGEGGKTEQALGETVAGYPKALKDLQVKWEEMHASGQLDELDLLSQVPPVVLDAILPPWHAKTRRKSKKSLVSPVEGEPLTERRKSLAKQPIGFRGEVPPEYTSVAARFSNFSMT